MIVRVDTLELRRSIAAHPWGSFALAVAAGAWLALCEPRGRIARAASRTLGMLALAALRDSATRHLVRQAHSWIDERARPGASATA